MSDLLDMKLEGVSNYSTPSKAMGKGIPRVPVPGPGPKEGSLSGSISGSIPGSVIGSNTGSILNTVSNTPNMSLSPKEHNKEHSIAISALAELALIQTQLAEKTGEKESLKKIMSQSQSQSVNQQVKKTAGQPVKIRQADKLSLSMSFQEGLSRSGSARGRVDGLSLSPEGSGSPLSYSPSTAGSPFKPSPLGLNKGLLMSDLPEGFIVPFRSNPSDLLPEDAAVLEGILAELKEGADKFLPLPHPSPPRIHRSLSLGAMETGLPVFYDMDMSRDEEESNSSHMDRCVASFNHNFSLSLSLSH